MRSVASNLMLSAWAALAALSTNIALAASLSVSDYASWIRTTSLLGVISTSLSPLLIVAARVDDEGAAVASELRPWFRSVANRAAVVGFALGTMCLVDFVSPMVATLSIWAGSIARSALDGLLVDPALIVATNRDKFIRAAIPTIATVAILTSHSLNFLHALALVGTTTSAGCFMAVWALQSSSEPELPRPGKLLAIYLREGYSLLLSVASLGVFAVPLYIAAIRLDRSAVAAVGIGIFVSQGGASFVNLALNRIVNHVAASKDRKEDSRFVAQTAQLFAAVSVSCAFGGSLVCYGYAKNKGLEPPLALSLTVGLLTVVECFQSLVTSSLLRRGDRHVLWSACAASVVNISTAFIAKSALGLLLAISASQSLCFLIPGLLRANLGPRRG